MKNEKTEFSPKRKRQRAKHAKQRLNQNLQRADSLLQSGGLPNDPQVAAILTKVAQAQSNREALEASLLLEKLLLGQNSTLEDGSKSDQLSAWRTDAEKRDRAAEAFNRDSEGFVRDVIDRTENKILTGSARDKVMARAASMKQTAIQEAGAKQQTKQLKLDWDIAHGPKVEVNATGQWTLVGPAGKHSPTLEPEVIRVMHRFHVLYPGLNKDVPKVFADRYENILQSRAETSEREKALGKSASMDGVTGMEHNALQARLAEIDRKFTGG